MFGENIMLGALTAPNYIYKEDIFGDSSCIGLYTMDYDFSDSSGNDNDMGVFGSPDHGVSGGLNLGARFDGYNTSARAYPVSDLQGLTSISISFWFGIQGGSRKGCRKAKRLIFIDLNVFANDFCVLCSVRDDLLSSMQQWPATLKVYLVFYVSQQLKRGAT